MNYCRTKSTLSLAAPDPHMLYPGVTNEGNPPSAPYNTADHKINIDVHRLRKVTPTRSLCWNRLEQVLRYGARSTESPGYFFTPSVAVRCSSYLFHQQTFFFFTDYFHSWICYFLHASLSLFLSLHCLIG